MRILTVSDKVEPVLYGPYIRERVGRVDLVLGCGDLPNYYLEYIVGLLDAPLYFVHGNHDTERVTRSLFDTCETGPDPSFATWGVNLHARSINHRGLLLAGLEGCRRYQPDAPFQYTEAQMRRQALMLVGQLVSNRVRYGRYLDILITHAPPHGIHDDQDLPHQGFKTYLKLMQVFKPRLLIHGHQHIYDRSTTSESTYLDTRVLNTYGYRLLELAPTSGQAGWELRSGSR